MSDRLAFAILFLSSAVFSLSLYMSNLTGDHNRSFREFIGLEPASTLPGIGTTHPQIDLVDPCGSAGTISGQVSKISAVMTAATATPKPEGWPRATVELKCADGSQASIMLTLR